MKTRYQILCAIASGIMICFSFPTVFFGWRAPDMGFLAWVAIVPLILAIREARPSKAFLITFVSGLVAYSGSLYWLYRAMNTYGKMSPVASVLVLVLLVVILSIYLSFAPLFTRFIQTRWRGEFIALLPVCWVAMEFCRNYVPMNGFPWSNIAMSQWKSLYVIQIVDLVGVYGLMFLIVWFNAFLAELILRLRGQRVSMFVPKIVATAVLVAATLGYGYVKYDEEIYAEATEGEVKVVGVIQPNIAQEDKWKESKLVGNLNKMRMATRKLRDAAVDLVIWPEASFPFTLDIDQRSIDPMAFGFDREEFSEYPNVLFGAITEKPDGRYYNSAFLFDAGGARKGLYHKAHLVPFGEYVPYEKIFFFARKLAEPIGKFEAGESFEPIRSGDLRIGPLICYEDVFPEIARKLTAAGANLLVNLTNDAWYGVSSAPYQHTAISVFRAVENRRYLVRGTNTGVSAIIAPTGKVEMESGIFEDALMVTKVRLDDKTTLYTRLGDWFAWACLAYTAFGLFMALIMKWRKKDA